MLFFSVKSCLLLGLAGQSLAAVARFPPRRYTNTSSTAFITDGSNITASFNGIVKMPPKAAPGFRIPENAKPVHDTPVVGPERPKSPKLNETIMPLQVPKDSEEMVITIYNSKDETIPLIWASNPRSPVPKVDGNRQYLEPGATLTIWAQPLYAGMVALGHGEGSKIEASYTPPRWMPHVDVSYVDGFTHEIVCSCGDTPVTGCNKNLWDLGKCPDLVANSYCRNVARPHSRGPPHPFFAPCETTAYTYSQDDRADIGCPLGNTIKCCVGPECESPKRQHP